MAFSLVILNVTLNNITIASRENYTLKQSVALSTGGSFNDGNFVTRKHCVL